MEIRRVGASGLRVSRMGLGTLTWGRDTDVHEARDLLTSFLEAGGTLIDTAPDYGDGVAEAVLGSLLDDVHRPSLVLSTKAGRRRKEGGPDVSRRELLGSLDASLLALRTDHVDLWSPTGWADDVPLEETLSALEVAVASGRARYAGVANYRGWQAARAASLEPALVGAHAEYSLLARRCEAELLPACGALGLGLLAWSPLGRGVLTGKYRHGTPADSRAASPHLSGFVEPYLDDGAHRVVDALVTAAEGLDCSPAEVALAWVRDRPGVSSVLLGARTAAQLRGCLTAEGVVVPDAIADALDEVSAPG